MIKINFKQKIAILLSTLVTTSGVSASNSKNLKHVNKEESFFSIKRDMLVQKSYNEKPLAALFTAVGVLGLVKGIFGKGKSKMVEETSKVNIPEPTIVRVGNSVGINAENIGRIVNQIRTDDRKLELLNVLPIGFGGVKEITNEDSFYIFLNYEIKEGFEYDLIVRFLNRNHKNYEERRKFYADNLERSTNLVDSQPIYGIYQNAVIMGVCCHRSCYANRTRCGAMKEIPSTLSVGKILFDKKEKVYHRYEHYNHESDVVKEELSELEKEENVQGS
ncbi:MAG: hypothetical protein FWC41_04115 [Firmicutes bacterium]|nr:hypothetical protein [Bacillota bacterium]